MKAPNIILIIMDTARRHNFSCYGYDRPTTPNIDELGKSGIIFERAISSSPWTLPSHVSFLSGETVKQHGITQELIYDNGNKYGYKFRKIDITKRIRKYLPLILKEKGYQCIGISNNPWICKAFGFHTGFDIFIDQYGSDLRFLNKVKKLIKINKLSKIFGPFVRKIMTSYRLASNKYDKGASKTVNLLKQFLSQNIILKNKPFFLFLNFFEPHLPYNHFPHFDQMFIDKIPFWKKYTLNQDDLKFNSNKSKMTKYDFEIMKSLYDGEIFYLDKKIGEIVDMFQEFSIMNDSVVIVTSDHGENIGDHKLMGHQLCIYDTLLAVPLILFAPEYLSGVHRERKYVMLKDLYYTIISLATGISDERSILNDKYNQPLVAEYERPLLIMGAIKDRYPHINLDKFNRELFALYNNGYKLIQSGNEEIELYNVEEDPFEMIDISLKELEIKQNMKKLLRDYYLNTTSLNKDYENNKDIQNNMDDQLIEEKLRAFGYIE